MAVEAESAFHALSVEEVLQKLETSHEGISQKEAEKRLETYGKNVLKEERTSKWKIFFRQCNNILIYILLAASLISISVGEMTDFFVILGIIIINTLIGFWQEVKAEASIEALKKMTESRHKVFRDGKQQLIHSSELVPGDYIVLHEGEAVTADIRLIESSDLIVDESSLTGESMPVLKDPKKVLPEDAMPYEFTNMLLAGTVIVRGMARGVIVNTGSRSYFAKIAERSQESSPETPLTKALKHFSKRYVIFLSVLFFLIGVVGYFQGRTILNLAYILLAGLVSAVPEGLPIVITLVMVIGALALSRKKALVRYLPSVETLGSATVIASDKTGTITEGNLIVKDIFAHDMEKLKHVAALCNDSHEGTGDPLDVALADWIEEFDEIREKFPRKWSYSFDPQHRLMATVNEFDGTEELLVKGAYESLKEKSKNEEKELQELDAAAEKLLEEGLRVLAFGQGERLGEGPKAWKIRIIGLIGFLDPAKEGVKEAVRLAKSAGIHVLMFTGDHPKTALAIAKDVGIASAEEKVLIGKEIEKMSDEELGHALQEVNVLARTLPEQKYRVVNLLQANRQIVAVTGDGVNDVPALKTADLGIAMGSGTDAAKNVSNMVITDNNLAVIVEAVKNGRVIADNIRKVIYYLISTSSQEVFLIALAIFSSLTLPLSAIQILWINIVTDGVQDKTFPFAKAEGDVMKRKPRRPKEKFLNWQQLSRIVYFGFLMGLICFFLYLFLLPRHTFDLVTTVIFTSVVAAQWANGIQAQKEREPFFKNIRRSFTINPWIFLGLLGGLLLQLAAIYAVPGWFHARPLSLAMWKYPVGIFFTAFFLVELRKWLEVILLNIKKT
ncbi:MAG: cation-transporting P-type ATPase [Simkaniaceae bacterium]